MTKPNELSGQVQPNTLRTPGPRVAGRTPPPSVANALSGQAPAPSGWASTAPAPPTISVPASSAPASGWTVPERKAPARSARRRFSLWTLIVIGIFVINILRAILGSAGGLGSEDPTTPPVQTAAVVVPPPTDSAAFTIDPSLRPGIVLFGTGKSASCAMIGIATTFSEADRVWWWAHFALSLPRTGRITFLITHDGRTLLEDTGPGDTPAGPWNGLCASAPIANDGPGTYAVSVSETTSGVVLASGQYTVAGASSTGGSPAPSARP